MLKGTVKDNTVFVVVMYYMMRNIPRLDTLVGFLRSILATYPAASNFWISVQYALALSGSRDSLRSVLRKLGRTASFSAWSKLTGVRLSRGVA